MLQSDLQIFVNATSHYFTRVGGREVRIGEPAPRAVNAGFLELTGIIGISGARRGALYFSCSRDMLRELARVVVGLKEETIDELIIRDMVGELANTVAGNADELIGGRFLISVPTVVEGQPTQPALPPDVPAYSIPMTWGPHEFFMVVGLGYN